MCQQSELHPIRSVFTPENQADLTLKKVGTAFLCLNECPGFRGIPEASWHAQSQIPAQVPEGNKNLKKRNWKRFKCETLNTDTKTLRKVRSPH